MFLSARLRRVGYVFVILAGAASFLGCNIYDGLSVGEPTEAGSGGHPVKDASAGGCNQYGDDACDDAIVRAEASMGDAAGSESGDRNDGGPTDQMEERGPSDVRLEIADESTPTDASNTTDAVDVATDASDVGDDETTTAEASDGDSAPADGRDGEPDTADVSDARSGDVSDVSDVAQPPTIYRAINVGGSEATALIIDGQNWEAGLTAPNVTYAVGTDAAGSGGLARVTIPLIPPTDTNRTSMIQTFAWGRPVTFTMSSVPAGRYLVYMYTWEDNGAQTFDVLLQGQVVLANYNSGADGHWERLGPWPVDVSAGTITISTQPLTGPAFANLCGVEVWRQ